MTLTAHKVGTYATGSPEWHQARAGKMSGSRIAAACGISPHESPYSLWQRMAGYIGEPEQTEAMYWGTVIEPAIIDRFAREHPELRVHRKPGTWLNNDRPWQLANPDALISPGPRRRITEVFEAKTARYDDDWGERGTDQIPIHYLAQVYWYLDTLGVRFCRIGALFTGSDYREYLVEYDAGAAADLRAIALPFLESLTADEPPDVDGHPATLRALKELHPLITTEAVDIPDDLGFALVRAKARLVAPTAAMNEAKARLVAFMGNAHTAYWDGIKIADRRAKSLTSTPYVQLAGSIPTAITVPPREKVSA